MSKLGQKRYTFSQFPIHTHKVTIKLYYNAYIGFIFTLSFDLAFLP